MVDKKIIEQFEAYSKGVKRLKEIEKELKSFEKKGLLRGFSKEKTDLKIKLKNVHLIPQIESEFLSLKAKMAGIDTELEKSKIDSMQDMKIKNIEEKEKEIETKEKNLEKKEEELEKMMKKSRPASKLQFKTPFKTPFKLFRFKSGSEHRKIEKDKLMNKSIDKQKQKEDREKEKEKEKKDRKEELPDKKSERRRLLFEKYKLITEKREPERKEELRKKERARFRDMRMKMEKDKKFPQIPMPKEVPELPELPKISDFDIFKELKPYEPFSYKTEAYKQEPYKQEPYKPKQYEKLSEKFNEKKYKEKINEKIDGGKGDEERVKRFFDVRKINSTFKGADGSFQMSDFSDHPKNLTNKQEGFSDVNKKINNEFAKQQPEKFYNKIKEQVKQANQIKLVRHIELDNDDKRAIEITNETNNRFGEKIIKEIDEKSEKESNGKESSKIVKEISEKEEKQIEQQNEHEKPKKFNKPQKNFFEYDKFKETTKNIYALDGLVFNNAKNISKNINEDKSFNEKEINNIIESTEKIKENLSKINSNILIKAR